MLHLMTIVFVILKVLGYIDWSWFVVFIPSMIPFALLISAIATLAILKIKEK